MDFGNWLLLQKKLEEEEDKFLSRTHVENFYKKNSRVEWKMRNDDVVDENIKKVKKKNENRLWTITKE